MSLETLAVWSVGILVSVRLLVTLIDSHYRAEAHVRRAANEAIAKMEAKLRAREARKEVVAAAS